MNIYAYVILVAIAFTFLSLLRKNMQEATWEYPKLSWFITVLLSLLAPVGLLIAFVIWCVVEDEKNKNR